jgi:hypothetical protein
METTKVIVCGNQGSVWMVYGVNDIELVTTESNYPKMFTGQRAWKTIMSKGEVTVFGQKFQYMDFEQLKEHNPKFREMVDEWLKEKEDEYFVLPESSENRQVTEDEYNTFKANFDRAVRNYKKYWDSDIYSSDAMAKVMAKELLEELDYKPLAYVPRVKYSRYVHWVDGHCDEHEAIEKMLMRFFYRYEKEYITSEAFIRSYDEEVFSDWREHTNNPNIVDLLNEENEWAMKVQEMRAYEITDEIKERKRELSPINKGTAMGAYLWQINGIIMRSWGLTAMRTRRQLKRRIARWQRNIIPI